VEAELRNLIGLVGGSETSDEHSTFGTDMATMFRSSKFADCTIVCDGKSIKCHKAILSARSVFFRNILEGNFNKGKNSDVIEMKDVSHKVLCAVLSYLYTDKISVATDREAVDVWCVADKYQMLHLKELVESYLRGSIKHETAMQLCIEFNLDLFPSLRQLVVGHLARNFDAVMDAKSFCAIPDEILHSILRAVKLTKTQQIQLDNDRFKWVAAYSAATIAPDGASVTLTTPGLRHNGEDLPTFFGNKVFKSGQHKWQVKVQFTTSRYACIGVAPSASSETRLGLGWSGYGGDMTRRGKGWAVDIGDGHKVSHTLAVPSQPFCNSLSAENQAFTIEVSLDLHKKTLELFHNGTSLGVAFDNVEGPVKPAVCFDGGSAGILTFVN